MVTSGASDSRDRPRNGRGRYVRSPSTAKRDADAARLRAEGYTYERIAQELRFSHRDLARRAVERALTATVREPADEARQIELIRLDSLWMQAMAVLQREHITVSNGRVVTIDVDGEPQPVPDDAPVLQAIDRLLKIMERRSKLLGLDAPAKVEVMSLDRIDQAIAELERELGAAEAGASEETSGTASGES
jgi:hypothetical protein